MHISENILSEGMGSRIHQDCRKIESHEVSFELLRRNLLLICYSKSTDYYSYLFYINFVC